MGRGQNLARYDSCPRIQRAGAQDNRSMTTRPARPTAIGGMGPNRMDARYRLRVLPCFLLWSRTRNGVFEAGSYLVPEGVDSAPPLSGKLVCEYSDYLSGITGLIWAGGPDRIPGFGGVQVLAEAGGCYESCGRFRRSFEELFVVTAQNRYLGKFLFLVLLVFPLYLNAILYYFGNNQHIISILSDPGAFGHHLQLLPSTVLTSFVIQIGNDCTQSCTTIPRICSSLQPFFL